MEEGTMITEAIKQAIGVESVPVVHEVEKGWLKRHAEAIDDPNPLWQDEKYTRQTRYGTMIASPTFIAALRDEQWSQRLITIDCPLKRVLNGGNEIEFYQPIRPGDRISVSYILTDATERTGKKGNKMVLLNYEVYYKNQFGDLVAKGTNTIIRH